MKKSLCNKDVENSNYFSGLEKQGRHHMRRCWGAKDYVCRFLSPVRKKRGISGFASWPKKTRDGERVPQALWQKRPLYLVSQHIRSSFNKFPDFFVQAFKIVVDSYCYTSYEMTDLFYDFRFKWTTTAAIGIHPTKTWLSQLVIFKNAI